MSTHGPPWTLGTLLYYTSSRWLGLCQSPPPRPWGAPYCLQRGIPTPGKGAQAAPVGPWSTFGSCSVWLWALSPSFALTPWFSLIVSAFPDPTHLSIFNYKIIYLLFFKPHCEACGILAPKKGLNLGQSSESTGLNHWTTRIPLLIFFRSLITWKSSPIPSNAPRGINFIPGSFYQWPSVSLPSILTLHQSPHNDFYL